MNAVWTILTLDPSTDEADLRRVLANKLKRTYFIKITKPDMTLSPQFRGSLTIEVAVLGKDEATTVQESFDVIDKRFDQWFRVGRDSEFASAYLKDKN